MKLRVGLVGLGSSWQQRHAPVLRALADRIEVRGVYEQVAHRAEQAAEAFDARCFESFRALILAEDIDAILMLAPQWYGQLPILAACDSGKHGRGNGKSRQGGKCSCRVITRHASVMRMDIVTFNGRGIVLKNLECIRNGLKTMDCRSLTS